MIILLHTSKIGMCEVFIRGFPDGSAGKESAFSAGDTGDWGSNPGLDSLEEEIATHPSILAWKIPWTEEPGRLYSPKCHRESDKTEHQSTSFYQGD